MGFRACCGGLERGRVGSIDGSMMLIGGSLHHVMPVHLILRYTTFLRILLLSTTFRYIPPQSNTILAGVGCFVGRIKAAATCLRAWIRMLYIKYVAHTVLQLTVTHITILLFFSRSSSPKALHMVSLTTHYTTLDHLLRHSTTIQYTHTLISSWLFCRQHQSCSYLSPLLDQDVVCGDSVCLCNMRNTLSLSASNVSVELVTVLPKAPLRWRQK